MELLNAQAWNMHRSQGIFLCNALVSILFYACVMFFGFHIEYSIFVLVWMVTLTLLTDAKIYYALVLTIMLGGLALVPVRTSTDPVTIITMVVGMAVVSLVPFIVHYFFPRRFDIKIAFQARAFTKREVGYILFCVPAVVAFLTAYFVYTPTAGSGWNMHSTYDVVVNFIAIMMIGAWEEVFFIAGVFGILSKVLPWGIANSIQAIGFSAFLWHIGFTGWIFPMVFVYAMLQGYIYKVTKNIVTTLIIHALVDLAVFLLLYWKLIMVFSHW